MSCPHSKASGTKFGPSASETSLSVIREAIEEHKPQIAFNLLEEFDGYPLFDQHMVSYLELKRQKYTGCNPRGLTLSHDKALTNKILAYHRINVPRFGVFPLKRKVRRPKRLTFPLFVKSVSDDGSVGISQASIVRDDEKLAERVRVYSPSDGLACDCRTVHRRPRNIRRRHRQPEIA